VTCDVGSLTARSTAPDGVKQRSSECPKQPTQ
jgi:hypothetical protein